MSAIRSAADAVYRWFYAPKPVHAISVTRALLGFILFFCYLIYTPDMEWYYGSDGLLVYMLNLEPPYTVTQAYLWPLFAGVLVSAVCFGVGLFTRPAGLCLAILHYLFVRFGVMHTWGWAETIPLYIVYVSLSGANRWLSVDAWWAARRGRPMRPEAPAWALRLLQFHVAMVYVAAAWHRIDDRAWIYGEIVYEALSNAWYTRLPGVDFQPVKPLLSLATWATEAAELSAPIALWIPRLRPYWVLALITLHAGLQVGASVGWWQPMMIAGLVSFVDPAQVSAGAARWRAWRAARAAA